MSVRAHTGSKAPPKAVHTLDPALLRAELEELRQQARAACGVGDSPALYTGEKATGVVTEAMRAFDQLTTTEQQAASLGVHPDAFRPLAELNKQHFESLRKANALDPQLESNIRAFQAVSEGRA